MTRKFQCFALAQALAALAALTAPAVIPVRAQSGTQPDSTAVPVKKDTIRAGEWKITGDVEQPAADAGPASISPEERSEIKGVLTQLGSGEVAGLRQWQRRKVPKAAMFSSMVLPGLGQLYDGRRIKVGLAAGFFSVYMGAAWMHWKDAQSWTVYRDKLPEDETGAIRVANAQIEFHKESARDFLWWSGAIWVIQVLDAWIDAHLYDLRIYTPPAVPGESPDTRRIAPRTVSKPIHYLTFAIGF
jgi:hypothetical protein